MSAEVLRRAASLMRERAEAARAGRWFQEGDEVRANWTLVRQVATCHGSIDIGNVANAAHIASWHPAVALAVADWLDAVAAVHWPKRHDRLSESHYNAEPEHECIATDCDEACWTEGYICNGCGTTECKPEITAHALAVARAYLGESA